MSRFRPSHAAKQRADGYQKPSSHEFIERWLNDEFVLLCCIEAWYEIVEKLQQLGVREELLEELGKLLRELCEPVEIVSNGRWCADPDDDKWLRLAIDGSASHLVTWDKKIHSARGPFSFRRVRVPGFLVELRAALKARAA